MKLAIAGKGGVGKTTLTSLLALVLAEQGRPVLAIDADPSPCLGAALGVPPAVLKGLTPIAEMSELIHDRTRTQAGMFGGFFKLNPDVDDIPDRFSVRHRGITLLELGAALKGGAGCICPESMLLKQLVTHILLRRDEVVLMDLYAGVEHLSRATTDVVDAMLVVAEPTARSLAAAAQIKALAADIGLTQLYLVGNKIESPDDRDYLQAHSPGLEVLGCLPKSLHVQSADWAGRAVYDEAPELAEVARTIVGSLEVAQ
jgi:CO dehydrogenase maturation factor